MSLYGLLIIRRNLVGRFTDRPFCRRSGHLAPEYRSLAPATAFVYRTVTPQSTFPDVATCLFANRPPRSLARLAGIRKTRATLAGPVQCSGSWQSGWGPPAEADPMVGGGLTRFGWAPSGHARLGSVTTFPPASNTSRRSERRSANSTRSAKKVALL